MFLYVVERVSNCYQIQECELIHEFLIHFMPLISFYNPLKTLEKHGFVIFCGDIEGGQ